jgi:transcriptional regulator of acetoin/glycerol metabolism
LVECVPVKPARREVVPKGVSWSDTERNFVYEALQRNNWNRSATADEMGIHTTTLWRKMKRLNIELP